MHQAEVFLQFGGGVGVHLRAASSRVFEFTVVEHEMGVTEDAFGMGPGRKGFEAQVAVVGPAGLTAAVVVD